MKTVFIESNGCVPNRLEGAHLISILKERGWLITDQVDKADLIIINYCGYSGDKIEESRKSVDKLNSIRRIDSQMVLTGCIDQISPKFKYSFPFSQVIKYTDIGNYFDLRSTFNKLYVSDNIIDILETTKKDVFNIVTSIGCLGKCSYCAIRKARGKLKSKPIIDIENELNKGVDLGYRKYILWADDLGAYGVDISTTYVEMLRRLINIRRDINIEIFLHRLNPQWVMEYLPQLMEILRSRRIRLLYVPIESGSPRVLQMMNRLYRIGNVIEGMKKIRCEFPWIILKTDISSVPS